MIECKICGCLNDERSVACVRCSSVLKKPVLGAQPSWLFVCGMLLCVSIAVSAIFFFCASYGHGEVAPLVHTPPSFGSNKVEITAPSIMNDKKNTSANEVNDSFVQSAESKLADLNSEQIISCKKILTQLRQDFNVTIVAMLRELQDNIQDGVWSIDERRSFEESNLHLIETAQLLVAARMAGEPPDRYKLAFDYLIKAQSLSLDFINQIRDSLEQDNLNLEYHASGDALKYDELAAAELRRN